MTISHSTPPSWIASKNIDNNALELTIYYTGLNKLSAITSFLNAITCPLKDSESLHEAILPMDEPDMVRKRR